MQLMLLVLRYSIRITKATIYSIDWRNVLPCEMAHGLMFVSEIFIGTRVKSFIR